MLEHRYPGPDGKQVPLVSSISDPMRAAQTALGKAAEHVRAFHARRTVPGVHNYVQAGHDAVKAIDQAIGELYRARGILVVELRADEDEQAARVDLMLHEWRESRAPGDDPTEANSGPGGEPR